MKETTTRRRFVASAGAASLVGTSGCLGGDNQQPDGDGTSNSGGTNGDDGGSGGSDDGGSQSGDQGFDFPPGADESGVVTQTLVAGGRQFLEETGQYRLVQRHDLNYADAPRDQMEITYDVKEETIHEQVALNSLQIDRWVTPDRTVGESVDTESDRTGRWRTETVDPVRNSNGAFISHPLEKSTVLGLIKSASLEFDEITAEGEQSYARYSGEITSSAQLELRQLETARFDYQMESISEGSVSILLAESGAIHFVEYEFSGEMTRLLHDARERTEIETSGSVALEIDGGVGDLTMPEWAESDGSVREFGFGETSLGRTYKLDSGPSLPGSVDLEYAEFYLTADFGEARYIDRYTPRTEFDSRAGVVAGIDEGGLTLDWESMSGQDAFETADRFEISVYLYHPEQGRILISHEVRYP